MLGDMTFTERLKTPAGRIILILVMVILLAHSVWRLWGFLKPIQTRIQDAIEIVQTDLNPERREEALKELWRIEVKDHPPVAPVIAKANEILQVKKTTGANYDREFGFFLWVVKFLEKHDRAGDSFALLTDIANYEPTDNITTGYQFLKADAKRVSLGIKVQQLQKTLDDLRNRPFNLTVPEPAPEPSKPTL
jgi:hypothetical protein